MSAHTPGPWHTEACEHFHYILAGDDIVASTWGKPHADNAAMIASAPELYEALRAIMQKHYPNTCADPVQLACAAIAKAEGR